MKTYIWTIQTRLFHWVLALSFTVAFMLGGEDNYLRIHAALGSLIGTLVLFRIIQGFMGPHYTRFRDFPMSPKSLLAFISDMKQSKASHPGHNPLAALVMLGIMVSALVSAMSGMLMFLSGDTGMFGFRINPGFDTEIFQEIHEVVVHLFLILVGVHLTGIIVDTVFHPGNGTILSIFTGYKRLQAKEAHLTPVQKAFGITWLLIPLVVFCYVLLYQPLPGDENSHSEHTESNSADND